MAKHTSTAFDNMEFPPYAFKEFPAAVPVVDGKVMPTPYNEQGKSHPVVIVNNQAEMDALLGDEPANIIPTNDGAGRVETDNDVRKVLLVQAEQVGAKVDARWSVARIEQAIKDHVAAKSAPASDVV